jgi:dCMP deaminase
MNTIDHDILMAMANEVADRSNCVRRHVGAIVVRDGQTISMGWNGVSEAHRNCREAGCPRCIAGGDTGSGYETCICIHAEQCAIADAARRGISTEGADLYVNLRPCLQCLAIAKAAGIRRIYFGETWTYPVEIEAVYGKLTDEFDAFSRIDEQPVNASEQIRSLARLDKPNE